jgi:cyclopropane fatty-acyl-phospholipid synthase-like methyltransferase
MFDEDEIPVKMLFRKENEMPSIERKALSMARGRTLDVGAGAGCHSLVLQQRGMDVTAIDISPLSVETMKLRGVKEVKQQDFFEVDECFDTILMLMNGIGIVGRLQRMPLFFRLLDRILAPGGQLLCDSSDICYVFENEDGEMLFPEGDGYYGELTYQMQYDDVKGETFPWLYIDDETLRACAEACGYQVEVVQQGEHYDYLARITKKR